MIIDDHVHLGRLRHEWKPLTAGALVRQLDRWGVDKAVALAVENPEELDYYVPTTEVLRACRRYPDRLIPFCSVDPRHRYPGSFNPRPLLEDYVAAGCRGFGEHLAGLPVDDPCNQVLYAACGELGLPLMMHFDDWINRDVPRLRKFEKMLKEFPETCFLAHGPGFWREISRGEMSQATYPTGNVHRRGRVDFLLSKYANLYGDLSAHSGYNAVTRDPAFGLEFLERQQDKLLFGTDFLRPGQDCPLVAFLTDAPLSRPARRKIMGGNARALLGL